MTFKMKSKIAALVLAVGAAGQVSASGGGTIEGTVTATPAKFAKNVAVYLEDAPKGPQAGATTTIDQKGMMFSPHVLVVTPGTAVTFKNSDTVPHNVFSNDNEKFDLGTMPPGQSKSYTFAKPGVYGLLCHMHPDMLAYVVVVPSGYFAVTGPDGKFSIAQVPDGTYTVTAWSEKLPKSSQKVTVKGGVVTTSFALHR